ncbi:MAG: protease modulator HflK [Myxococcota bacterium]
MSRRFAPPTRRGRDGTDETTRLIAPFMELAAGLFVRLHGVVLVLLALYAGSGLTVIEADEVGMVLRFGKLVGHDPAAAVHPPGLLFVLPPPIDEVVRVEVGKVYALRIDDLYHLDGRSDGEVDEEIGADPIMADFIGPHKEGYVLTADRNILHARIIARYEVGDPIAYALYVADHDEVLRASVLGAVVQATGEVELDDLLGGGRDDFIRAATVNAQNRLDGVGAGLELVSIEFEELFPARQVIQEFDAVQSAFIAARTVTEQANSYAARTVPAARAVAEAQVSEAQACAARTLGRARSGAKAFEEILETHRADPSVLRERLYQEGIERALDQGGKITFVPAPIGERYTSMRVSISTSTGDKNGE